MEDQDHATENAMGQVAEETTPAANGDDIHVDPDVETAADNEKSAAGRAADGHDHNEHVSADTAGDETIRNPSSNGVQSDGSLTPHSNQEEFVEPNETPPSSIHTEEVLGKDSHASYINVRENGNISPGSDSRSMKMERLSGQNMDEINLDDDRTTARPSFIRTTTPSSGPSRRSPFGWLRSSSSPSKNVIPKSNSPPFTPDKRKHSSAAQSVVSVENFANNELLVSRLEANTRMDDTEKEAKQAATQELYREFVEKRKEGDEAIDWDFWEYIIREPLSAHPHDLSRAICAGIPSEIRGTIWQLLSNSRNATLEQMYNDLATEDSVHVKAIKRDLNRTSYKNEKIQSEDMLNVVKAYGLYDPEVGYTQGMTFLVAPMLLNVRAHIS